MTNCPCGSERPYENCCEEVIRGRTRASTPEALMRARYSAFVTGEIDFIMDSVLPDQREAVDRDGVEKWSKESAWRGLEILGTEGGGDADEEGVVEFIARFAEGGQELEHHERACFRRVDGEWYFDMESTEVIGPKPIVAGPKVGRNDPCPCGSGRKYKKCCGAA